MSEQQGFDASLNPPNSSTSAEIPISPEINHVIETTSQEFDQKENNLSGLPPSAEAFTIINPSNGRVRLIPSFNDQLYRKLGDLVNPEIQQYARDGDYKRIQKVEDYIGFIDKARKFYENFEFSQGENVAQLVQRMKYLGLTKNLVVEGEHADLIQSAVKSADFGRLTSEDRGFIREDGVAKSVLKTGKNPEIQPITPSAVSKDEELFSLISNITTDKSLEDLLAVYKDSPEVQQLIEWTARQTIVRKLLPREHDVQPRRIDMNKLKKVKDMSADADSPEMERFQASNPISLWNDPDTGRRFIVKHCPEQTLQADYFGLEMLQLAGTPIYEFYFGETTENGEPKKVLVTGFLEGFSNPADLYNLQEGDPEAVAKAHFPTEYHNNRIAQRGLLMETFIGEYNSKPHNFMVHGKSVQHLDQGACLTSTASGKFKGLSEHVSIQDMQDVLYSYADWDFNQQHPVNEAYEKIVTIDNGQLVVKDIPYAEKLLHQLQSIPQEKIDAALESSGYKDGPESIQRMQEWITRIETTLLPGYQKKLIEQPSERVKQYIRWSESAIKSFRDAIAEGGELSYYKKVLRTRKQSLESLWQQSIEEAKTKKLQSTNSDIDTNPYAFDEDENYFSPQKQDKLNTVEGLEGFREEVGKADNIVMAFPYHMGDSLVALGYVNGVINKTQALGLHPNYTFIVPNYLVDILKPLEKPGLKIIPGNQVENRDNPAYKVNSITTAKTLINNDPQYKNVVLLDFEDHTKANSEIIEEKNEGKSVTTFTGMFMRLYGYGSNDEGNNRYKTFATDLLGESNKPEPLDVPTIPLPANHEDLYRDISIRHGIDMSNLNQISVNLESGSTGRQYSIEKWIETMKEIQEAKPNMQINFIVNSNKKPNDPTLVDKARLQRSISLAGLQQTHIVSGNLPELVSLYNKQKLILSNDGGTFHVAAATEGGPKVVGLFLPGYADNWNLNVDKVLAIEAPPGMTDESMGWSERYENRKWINKIDPETIAHTAIRTLQ